MFLVLFIVKMLISLIAIALSQCCHLQVKHLRQQGGVYLAQFDQCRFGLVSAVNKTPIKKKTSVLTNSLKVFQSLHEKYCLKDHSHQVIQGSEGGQKRSTAAQEYPQPLCMAICQAFLEEQNGRWKKWVATLRLLQLLNWHLIWGWKNRKDRAVSIEIVLTFGFLPPQIKCHNFSQ